MGYFSHQLFPQYLQAVQFVSSDCLFNSPYQPLQHSPLLWCRPNVLVIGLRQAQTCRFNLYPLVSQPFEYDVHRNLLNPLCSVRSYKPHQLSKGSTWPFVRMLSLFRLLLPPRVIRFLVASLGLLDPLQNRQSTRPVRSPQGRIKKVSEPFPSNQDFG